MAGIKKYQDLTEKIIGEYSQLKPFSDDIEVETIFDRERNHFQLLRVGWHENQRFCECVMHVDIKNGKIWIQHDGTERGIANDLLEMGVPKSDIVLAFHAPYKRKYTGFAEN